MFIKGGRSVNLPLLNNTHDSPLNFGIDKFTDNTVSTDAYYVLLTEMNRLGQLNPGVKELLFRPEGLYSFGVSLDPVYSAGSGKSLPRCLA